ncbi:hypothetical protein QQ020_11925 [Fulvivirgaceae bacterium BMA12]|uniref:Beta-hexosaminidase bacterial type N-terminal domain-containing protein n=1 Tax=Agaribacillus aureus TaxID=3051825 RepID=A0ABT8L939_9BACT|nr:hypothetical protein [Fulvivirgaceae bacterium BMA12]
MKNLFSICLITWSLCACSVKTEKGLINIFIEKTTPQTEFAVNNIESLYGLKNIKQVKELEAADIIVKVDTSSQLKPEGYSISGKDRIVITGKDGTGAMYGILDVAEQISFGKKPDEIEEKVVIPYQRNRFIKFNLPWNSYRNGEALSLHMETCRDTVFWHDFLDMMAMNRFNVLSLWNLHPFEDMIKPEKYPEASSLSDEELAERKKFYTTIFRMAKERGVQTYIVNWNIFVSKKFAEAHNIADYNKTGGFWGDADNSELIEDYTRECIRQLINDYPDLTGLGITLGERMGGMTSTERRDWINRTVIKGMSMADRKVKLLYRAPLSAGKTSHGTTDKTTEMVTREVLDTLTIPEETMISFKYNWSHGHSSDKLFIVHGGKLTDTYWNPAPHNYSVLWTIRNEDFFTHRWAKPDFVRNFLKNNMKRYTSGCIIGSECYLPAKDYFTKSDIINKPFKYAFERQWLWYSIWGRLLYDDKTEDKLFADQLNRKFDIKNGEKLLETWKLASDYYHRFASFYMGTWDATIYSEAFTALLPDKVANTRKANIITMAGMGNRPVLDTTKYINIQDYVLNPDRDTEQIVSPVELANIMYKNAEKVLEAIPEFDGNQALNMEVTDLELLAYLQKFFAERILATLVLADKIVLKKELDKERIDKHLKLSIDYWKKITELKGKYNKKVVLYLFNADLDYNNYLEVLAEERKNVDGIDTFYEHDLR